MVSMASDADRRPRARRASVGVGAPASRWNQRTSSAVAVSGGRLRNVAKASGVANVVSLRLAREPAHVHIVDQTHSGLIAVAGLVSFAGRSRNAPSAWDRAQSGATTVSLLGHQNPRPSRAAGSFSGRSRPVAGRTVANPLIEARDLTDGMPALNDQHCSTEMNDTSGRAGVRNPSPKLSSDRVPGARRQFVSRSR
jgi:hypothetical protein